MRKSIKICLIVAVSLVVVGSLVFVGALAALRSDFNKLNTRKYETNTYEISEDFNKISIDVTTSEVMLAPSENDKCIVKCFEEDKLKHSVKVEDGTLRIKTIDTRKWYDHIGISFRTQKVTVYLPKNEYESLLIETDTDNVEVPKDFSFENIKISGDTSDIFCYASASGVAEISTSTGNIKMDSISADRINLSSSTGNISLDSAVSKGEIKIKTDTGLILLADVNCKNLITKSDTGDISMKNITADESISAESDTGDVRFKNSDAASISVKTDTGNVTGTLASEKIFITQTSTGDVSVPKTTTGEKCEITTDTGDIDIDIDKR